VVVSTTICAHSIDLVDWLLALEFWLSVPVGSFLIWSSSLRSVHLSLSPLQLPHPQGACSWSIDHLCVRQVLCTHVICLDLVAGPANPVTTARTTSINCRPRSPSWNQAQPNPLACSTPSEGDRGRLPISNCPSKVNQNTFEEICFP